MLIIQTKTMKRKHIEALPRVFEILIGFSGKVIAFSIIGGALSAAWIDWTDSKRRNVQIKRRERK